MRSRIAVLLALVSAVLVSGTSMAQPPQGAENGGPMGGPPWMKARIMFQLFDANRDGALTAEEAPEIAWQHLSAADADDDGKVTQAEVAALVATRVISNFDENEDGELTADETPAPMWDRLKSADVDASRSVSADEIVATILAAPRRGGPPVSGNRGNRPST